MILSWNFLPVPEMASLPLSLSLNPTAKQFLNLKPSPTISLVRKSTLNVSPSRKPLIPRMSLNPATDRVISAAAYTLPFLNSIQYGRYLFTQFPQLSNLFNPIFPLLTTYRSIPYSSFIAFFALYLAVARNSAFSRYVRFNAMQAVTLDVLLVVPNVLTQILSPGQMELVVWGHSAVFVFSCFCFVYGFVSSILGRTPYLPFIGDAARNQY